MIPADRTVHYIDLGRARDRVQPAPASTPARARRAAVFVRALIEANPPGAIQAASDSFCAKRSPPSARSSRPPRSGTSTACSVRRRPTTASPALDRLEQIPGADFARYYWRREFPALLATAATPRRCSTRRATSSTD